MHLGDSMRVTFFVSSEDGGSSNRCHYPASVPPSPCRAPGPLKSPNRLDEAPVGRVTSGAVSSNKWWFIGVFLLHLFRRRPLIV